ncbi:MAG: hypothetical protein AAGI15_10955, partial [Pseudomonadota bacterium]
SVGTGQRRFLSDLLCALATPGQTRKAQQVVLRPESLPADLAPDERVAALLGFVSKRVEAAQATMVLLAGELAPELITLLEQQPFLAALPVAQVPPLEPLLNDGKGKRALWQALSAQRRRVSETTPGHE